MHRIYRQIHRLFNLFFVSTSLYGAYKTPGKPFLIIFKKQKHETALQDAFAAKRFHAFERRIYVKAQMCCYRRKPLPGFAGLL